MTELILSPAEHLWTGAVWSEGPLWMPAENAVRWSDIPGDRILRWDAATGETTEHRAGVEFTNGRALDRDGTVVQCSHGRRRLEREGADGALASIADAYAGVRLNSPNDVAVAPDGAYWFTDPDYGITQPREGHPGEREYGACGVFRVRDGEEPLAVILDLDRPNGIAFSPDGRTLYVTDTGAEPAIHAYDVVGEGVANGRFFAAPGEGVPDGIAVDVEGRVWSSAGDGVHVYAPDGGEVAFAPVPEVVANVCFGGTGGDELFIAATTSLYRVRTATRGL
ncbi:SMP-30/gluconolactonase/LRE family protein [Microbacterium gilvum]|uniref:SMP-30/gluconolactonase/LRE family protein n=1 Tax=Microbacterium gilvum TaxID=1336204 RepID=A0ABP9A3E4_9MICO